MEVEQVKQSSSKIFERGTKEQKQQIEQQYLEQLESLPQEKYADGASAKLNHYIDKRNVDTSQYYESKFKPLENDVSNSDEAYQNLMKNANVLEYGSNFNTDVYDPKKVIQSQEELIDSILKRSVKQSFNSIIKQNQPQAGGQGSNIPLTGPAAIAARFTGYSTTLKNFVPTMPPKQ